MIFEKRLSVGFALVLVCLASAVLADDKKAVEEVKASSEEVITSPQQDANDEDVMAEKKEDDLVRIDNPLKPRALFGAIFVTIPVVSNTTHSYYTTCKTKQATGNCAGRRRRRSVAIIDVPDDSKVATLDTSIRGNLDSFDRHSLTLGGKSADAIQAEGRVFPSWYRSVTMTFTSTYSTINTATTIYVSVACSFTPDDGYTAEELYLRACGA